MDHWVHKKHKVVSAAHLVVDRAVFQDSALLSDLSELLPGRATLPASPASIASASLRADGDRRPICSEPARAAIDLSKADVIGASTDALLSRITPFLQQTPLCFAGNRGPET